MTIRSVGALLCGAMFVLATQTGTLAANGAEPTIRVAVYLPKVVPPRTPPTTSGRQAKPKGNAKTGAAGAVIPTFELHTSDRMGGGGGKGAASRAKSNTGDRTGGVVESPPMGGMIFFGRRRF